MTFLHQQESYPLARSDSGSSALHGVEGSKIKMDSRLRGNDVKRGTPAAAPADVLSEENYPLARSDSGSSALHGAEGSKIKMDSRLRGNDVKSEKRDTNHLLARREPRSREPPTRELRTRGQGTRESR